MSKKESTKNLSWTFLFSSLSAIVLWPLIQSYYRKWSVYFNRVLEPHNYRYLRFNYRQNLTLRSKWSRGWNGRNWTNCWPTKSNATLIPDSNYILSKNVSLQLERGWLGSRPRSVGGVESCVCVCSKMVSISMHSVIGTRKSAYSCKQDILTS